MKFNKFHAKKVIYNGITFDSQKEFIRYQELKLLEKSGIIKNLERQKKFELIPKTKTERACYYKADFVYDEGNKKIVEDTKGFKTKDYIIKRKLMKWLYPQYVFKES